MLYLFVIGALFQLLFFFSLAPIPTNSPFEPFVIHSVRGTDKYYTEASAPLTFSLQASPYYQHTRKARNKDGRKVPIGDRLGTWNMFGIFYGTGGAPTDKVFNDINYPKISESKNKIAALATPSSADASAYHGKDYTDESVHNPERDSVGYYEQVQAQYERYGVRTEFSFLFPWGLGFKAATGVARYTNKPKFILNNDFLKAAGQAYYDDGVLQPAKKAGDTTGLDSSAVTLYEYLMSDSKRTQLFDELDLYAGTACSMQMEDIYCTLFWHYPFPCRNDEEDVLCYITPYLALGLILPSGVKTDERKLFSITTGNNEYTGLSFDLQLDLVFPQMLQCGVGGGLVASLGETTRTMAVPTSIFQQGFYPWKEKVKKDTGLAWYLNLSLKAEFIRYITFYADYIFVDHLKDSLTMCSQDAARKKLFEPGLRKLEDESCWRHQMVHIGSEVGICPLLTAGFAVQATITGVRTYHLTGIIGTVRFTF